MTDDRSNERADVARRILELSGTVEEAINYLAEWPEFPQDDIGVYAAMLKDVGEGLNSLENAVSAISGQMGSDPEDITRLAAEYDGMCERLDEMADAYLEDRPDELFPLGGKLRESFSAYASILMHCFRNGAVM
jgi:hypothetical protein